MNITTFPGPAKGEITAPPSKSYSQRAVAAALLADGETVIRNIADCDDVRASMTVIEKLGADIYNEGNSVGIKGVGGSYGFNPATKSINCAESGLCLRIFSAITALSGQEIELRSEGSLAVRSVDFAGETFEQLAVEFSSNNSFPPLSIRGPLVGGRADVDGSGGSQFLSGLLIALPLCANDSHLPVHNLKSKFYIDMTIDTLAQFAVKVSHNNYEEFFIKGGQKYKASNFTVEGDWSGASTMLTAAAISGEIYIKGLNHNSKQPDRAILNALESAGAEIEIDNKIVSVRQSELQAFDFDATHSPDLFPALTVLAVNCSGTSRIKGVSRLINKESNRGAALTEEFNKLGAKITVDGDYMLIEGSSLTGGTASSHNDHRIAMALAVAAFNSENPIVIQDSECVNKSYPNFFADLQSVGMRTEERL